MEYHPDDYAKIFEQFGRISEALIRVEGMKAENVQRAIRGESLAYVEKNFNYEAENVNAAVNYLKNWG